MSMTTSNPTEFKFEKEQKAFVDRRRRRWMLGWRTERNGLFNAPQKWQRLQTKTNKRYESYIIRI